MKAKIIIDMPFNCFYCPCRCIEYEECRLMDLPIETKGFEDEFRPYWCPLIPVDEENNEL
jgi:hypothetical protein